LYGSWRSEKEGGWAGEGGLKVRKMIEEKERWVIIENDG
jgi:hypothetical protein